MTAPDKAGKKQAGASKSVKAAAGRWRAGQSGNPAGRKPGTGEVTKLRAGIAEHIPDIVDRLVEQAKEGDVAAARLLLERVVSPLRATDPSVAVELPQGSLTDQGRAVFEAMAAGTLSPSQAAELLAALGALVKLVDADEVNRRLDAIEARQRAVGGGTT